MPRLAFATLTFLFAALPIVAVAKNAGSSVVDAVNHYFRATENGDAAELGKGFQPTAMMYSVNEAGALIGTSQFGWKAALGKAAKPKSGENRNQIVSTDAGQEIAVVKTLATRGSKSYVDYILAMRLGKSWKIVGKVYSQANAPENADLAAARSPVEAKIASDQSWDVTQLLRSLHDRALVFSVEEQQMVVASPQEWAARYVDRKNAKQTLIVSGLIDHVETTGDVGYAHWHITAKDGSIWHDRALMVHHKGEWRIIALAYTNHE
jgi:hypothetical protein